MADSLAGVGSVMIGVGGLLDVIAGDVPRAPENWQRAGMEWLFRLLREPRRMPRAVQLPMVLVIIIVMGLLIFGLDRGLFALLNLVMETSAG